MRPLRIVCLCLCLGQAASCYAQGFDKWFDDQVAAVLKKQQVGQNGKGSDRQRQSPSGDSRSTSLVDNSSASDFVSLAVNLIPVPSSSTGGANSGTSGSTTATATLYAVLAGLNHASPTDPEFYKAHVDARRWSFTAGTAASTVATDNSDKPAAVLGTKFLLWNGRELYRADNLAEIKRAQAAVSAAAKADALLKPRIQILIFEDQDPKAHSQGTGQLDTAEFARYLLSGAFSETNFPTTLSKLKPATLKQIADILTASIDVYASLDQTLKDAYDHIQKNTQISLAYTSNLRKDQGNNYHRAEFIVDYGLSTRINWTLNASADYTDRKLAKDSRGGRVATEFQGNLTKPGSAWARLPMRLSFSGEAKWLTGQKPQYTVQSQLTIPLSQGLDLPVTYRYANRAALVNLKDSEVRLGFSVDLSRLAQVFK